MVFSPKVKGEYLQVNLSRTLALPWQEPAGLEFGPFHLRQDTSLRPWQLSLNRVDCSLGPWEPAALSIENGAHPTFPVFLALGSNTSVTVCHLRLLGDFR